MGFFFKRSSLQYEEGTGRKTCLSVSGNRKQHLKRHKKHTECAERWKLLNCWLPCFFPVCIINNMMKSLFVFTFLSCCCKLTAPQFGCIYLLNALKEVEMSRLKNCMVWKGREKNRKKKLFKDISSLK